MSKKIEIPRAHLKSLYIKRNMSTYQIAKIYDCNPTAVQNRLREYGIPLREPKKEITIEKSKLRHLYEKENLSTYKIAKKLGIGRTTIYMKLVENGIKTRPLKRVKISEKRLKELYLRRGLSLSEIADMYDCTGSIILDKMRGFGIERRNASDANSTFKKAPFENDPVKKAYMIGFRLGDLKAVQVDSNCSVVVSTNTTKTAQVDLIRDVFGCYGHFYSKTYGNVHHVSCQLDKSFGFLAPKKDEIEPWILGNDDYFFAFLGGYSDAEGNIGIYDGRARFRVGTYDKRILYHVHKRLNELGINAKYYLETEAGRHNQNGDMWRVSINEKGSLLKLFSLLGPHLRHEKRVNDLKKAKLNILQRNDMYGAGK